MVFWKTDRRKPLTNFEKEKRKRQGKSNNDEEHISFYLLYKKLIRPSHFIQSF